MKLVKMLVLPYLKRFWLMLLSVIFVGAFGCGILIGLRDTYLILEEEANSFIEEYGFPDLTIGSIDFERTKLKDLPADYKEQLNIENITYRVVHPANFSDEKGIVYNSRLFSYTNDDYLSQYIYDKNDDYLNGLRMEKNFAEGNNFKVGDIINIKMPNGDVVSYPIAAIILSPECTVVQADAYALSSTRDFAYIYLPLAEINKHSAKAIFNEILVDFIDGKEVDTKEVSDLFTDYNINLNDYIKYMYTYDESNAIKETYGALDVVNYISLGVPVLFFVIVLVVTALFLTQIIKQCRKDIGIMRAIGETKGDIIKVFMGLSLLVSILSWIIGIGLGAVITFIAKDTYGSALRLPPLPFKFNIYVLLISFVALVVVGEFTALMACLGISKIKPVEAMKALPPVNNNTPFLTRTLFKNAPIPLKVSVSQNIRNIKRYVISSICIFASVVMILVALVLGESKKAMLSQLFDARFNYDAQIYLDYLPADPDQYIKDNFYQDGKLDPNIEQISLIKYLPAKLEFGTNSTVELINGIKSDEKLINVVSDYNNIIKVPNDEIILSKIHADKLGVKPGDIIKVNGVDVKVGMISNEYLYQVSYMDFDYIDSVMVYAEPQASILIKTSNTKEISNKYSSLEHVTYISFNEIVKEEYSDRLAAFDISSLILNFIAIVMGFLIVFNMTLTNLKEQKRTFATMRTLGFQRSSISNANLLNSIFQFIIASGLGIPAGMGLSHILLNTLSSNQMIFPYPHVILMYFLCIILVLSFLLISHFIAMSDMKRWNLPECVKERE